VLSTTTFIDFPKGIEVTVGVPVHVWELSIQSEPRRNRRGCDIQSMLVSAAAFPALLGYPKPGMLGPHVLRGTVYGMLGKQ
jgi:hypothetical protein